MHRLDGTFTFTVLSFTALFVAAIFTGPGNAWAGEWEDAERSEGIIEIEREIENARREIDEAARELAKLHKKKYAMGSGEKRAMLGILIGEKGSNGGVSLVGVTPGGGAEGAGMEAGDKIVSIGGVSLAAADNPHKALGKVIHDAAPGDVIPVQFERDGETIAADITTQAREAHMIALLGDKLTALEGMELKIDLSGVSEALAELPELSPELKQEIFMYAGSVERALMGVEGDLAEYFDVERGVVVREAPADTAIKAGDVLVSIGGTEVVDVSQAADLLEELEADTQTEVVRHGRKRMVTLSAGAFAELGEKATKRVIRIKTPHAPGANKEADEEVIVKVEVIDD